MKNEPQIVFAIYKNGNHWGNDKGENSTDAIKKYLTASISSASINGKEFSPYTPV